MTTTDSSASAGRVLVTGANGFLGSRIGNHLCSDGHEVLGTGRRRHANRVSYTYRRAELSSHSARHALLDGVETVVHCAGLAHKFQRTPSDGEFRHANAALTKNIVAAAAEAEVRRIVLISSSSVYGSGRSGMGESQETGPETAYAKSKLEAERLAAELCTKQGLALTILRPATIYGVGDPGNIRRLIESIVSGRFIWIGRGENAKSLVAVEDVAAAVARVVAFPPPERPETYNLAAPPLAMRQIVEAIALAAGTPQPRWKVPAAPLQAVLRYADAASFGAGPVARINRTVDKWLSNDTIDATRFEQRFAFAEWRDFRTDCAAEVQWGP